MQNKPTPSTIMAYLATTLLSNSEAAVFLGVSPQTLEVWRSTKRYSIPYVKVGRLIKYRREDLEKWLASRSVNGTEEG